MLHVLSLGAGVQSSTMALMYAHGELSPMPHAAIFADTQAEPANVYKWLDWLETKLPYPVLRVSAGDLAVASTQVKTSKTGTRYLRHSIPAFIVNGSDRGMAMRQCTRDFKIDVIHRELRKLRKQREDFYLVSQYIGISFDELHRMKPARESYMTNHYPLVERRMTRLHCIEWMERQGYPKPPRSACVFCPYHSDQEWRRLRDEEPAEFTRAVEFERQYQAAYAEATALQGTPYLHASRKPLLEVDFTDSGQQDLWGNECEGMCGV